MPADAPLPSPAASVIIPAWNRAGSVARSVSSVLAQSFEDYEIVVVDDGSTDPTPDVVEAIPDPRVKLLRTPHGGVSAARNAGAAAARGAALLFLDSDDEALPGWLSRLSRPVLAGEADIAVSGWRLVDRDGNSSEWLPDPARLSPDDLAPRFLAGSWAVSRDLFDRVGGFDPEISYGENTEIGLRLLLALPEDRVSAIREVLARVRARPAGVPHSVRAENARLLLSKHRPSRTAFPRTWASYQTLAGVDDARNRRYLRAAQRFCTALRFDPRGGRRASRLLLVMMPGLARRIWGEPT